VQSLARWPISLHKVHFLRVSGGFLRKPLKDILALCVMDMENKNEQA